MKYIRRINEKLDKKFLNNFNFCKEELDKLSLSEIKEVKLDLVLNNRPDHERKRNEIDIYINDRNPDININMYNKWLRKSKITKRVSKSDGFYDDYYHDEVDNDYFTELDMGTFKFLVEVVYSFGGPEAYFKHIRNDEIKKLGKSKYGLY